MSAPDHRVVFERLFRLDGKVAVITGSTRGIGLATARLMAEAGARVVISSRKPESCNAVESAFRSQGFEAVAVPCHVAKEADRIHLIDAALQAFGRVDVLVANAAVNPIAAPIDEVPAEVWDKVLDTNLRAPWHLSQLVLPGFSHQGGGAIVLVSSIASMFGYTANGAYGVSKAGLNQLGRDLAVASASKNVRVNTVVPGGTMTDMVRTSITSPEILQDMLRDVPLGRFGEPRDVAAAILFLASEAGRQITGQTLVVDGGATIFGGR
jgi:NAD(P)-dependent dehydrogenase (short-subunit alcohol dehydrogenase family)